MNYRGDSDRLPRAGDERRRTYTNGTCARSDEFFFLFFVPSRFLRRDDPVEVEVREGEEAEKSRRTLRTKNSAKYHTDARRRDAATTRKLCADIDWLRVGRRLKAVGGFLSDKNARNT